MDEDRAKNWRCHADIQSVPWRQLTKGGTLNDAEVSERLAAVFIDEFVSRVVHKNFEALLLTGFFENLEMSMAVRGMGQLCLFRRL